MNGMANKKNYFQTFLMTNHPLDKGAIINLEAGLEEGAEVEAEVEVEEEVETEVVHSFRVILTLVMLLRIHDLNIKIITTKRMLIQRKYQEVLVDLQNNILYIPYKDVCCLNLII
jgi:hypothetical protein